MAKCIHICSRKILPENIYNTLTNICDAISPDNIIPRPPQILVENKVALAVMNPSDTVGLKSSSLLMGMIFDQEENWYLPKTRYPLGSYALFRDTEEYCEIVSDATGSRTIWYYFNEHFFISSTSQRAIIMFLGNFEFNEKVIPW